MLELEGIEKSYGDVKALKGVSFNVKAGEVTALLARNGAGKSTLIGIIAGLLAADAGSVHINGELRRGKSLSRDRQHILGIAGQETGIFPGLTVRENLSFFADIYRVPGSVQSRRVFETAELLGLTSLLNQKGHALSGGQKRRLHTAAALLHKPKLLLLDEPTVGADPQARNDILRAVRQLADEGTAVIYTSHYFPEIEALGARLVIMEQGEVLVQGSQTELLQRYGRDKLTIAFDEPVSSEAAVQIPGSLRVDDHTLEVTQGAETPLNIAQLLRQLGSLGEQVRQCHNQRANLEQMFLHLIQTNKAGDKLCTP